MDVIRKSEIEDSWHDTVVQLDAGFQTAFLYIKIYKDPQNLLHLHKDWRKKSDKILEIGVELASLTGAICSFLQKPQGRANMAFLSADGNAFRKDLLRDGLLAAHSLLSDETSVRNEKPLTNGKDLKNKIEMVFELLGLGDLKDLLKLRVSEAGGYAEMERKGWKSHKS